MFSTSNSSKVTAARVVAVMMMMMMMMMREAAAMPKHMKTSMKSDGTAVETVPLQLDPNSLAPSRHFRPLANASTSPWAYNISRDDSLFPPVLSEARCLLQGCLGLDGKEDQNLESKPIMNQVLLLRRVRSAGAGHSYHYRLESRLIAVGCTCVRPIVLQQQ